MSISIRTRLTGLIALVFLCVVVFLLTAAALAFYAGVTEDVDAALEAERQRVLALLTAEYGALRTAPAEERDALMAELDEDLHDRYGASAPAEVRDGRAGDADEDAREQGDELEWPGGVDDAARQFIILSLDSLDAPPVYAGIDLTQLPDRTADTLLSKPDGAYHQRLNGVLYRVLTSRNRWGTLVLGRDNRMLFEVAEAFSRILLPGIPIMLLVILIGGRFLAARALRPVVAAAQTAEQITLTNLAERIPPSPGHDEFSMLISTFNRLIARLEDDIRRIQRFTQDAAHELRTPLTILRGELELSYQHDRLPDDVRASLQKSLDRTIGMSTMVENLMLLARSDGGRYPLRRKTFPFDEVLRDVAGDIELLVEQRPITVCIERCDPVLFTGDEALIRRLMLNLADNALKCTSAGRITFRLAASATRLECSISDTGRGIPEADLTHIFDRFYRVDASGGRSDGSRSGESRSGESRSGDGSGLGLAICKWIVTAHGGEIRVDSAVSRGTTVAITLPVSRPLENPASVPL